MSDRSFDYVNRGDRGGISGVGLTILEHSFEFDQYPGLTSGESSLFEHRADHVNQVEGSRGLGDMWGLARCGHLERVLFLLDRRHTCTWLD